MTGSHRPLVRPHRPDYVPADARYVRTRTYRPRRVHRVILRLLAAALIWMAIAVLAVLFVNSLHHDGPGTVPGRGVHTTPAPGSFTTMPNSMYTAPVIPGPDGARRARLVPVAAAAARPGQPGHLEKLITNVGAVWTLTERGYDITDRA